MSINSKLGTMKRRAARVDFADMLDDMLDSLGLTRKRPLLGVAVPILGVLAAGIAIGAGLGLLFAPTSGRQLRSQAESKVGELKQRLASEANDISASP